MAQATSLTRVELPGRVTVIPAGTSIGPRERGDWVKLTQKEQAILRATIKFALGHAAEESAIRTYAPELLDKLGEKR